jgi:hypothetical protein
MTIHVQTWDQSKFLRPGRKFQSYKDEGEFDDISGLYPDRNGERLLRGPAWSSHVPWPSAAETFVGFSKANVVLPAGDSNYFIFLGKLTTPANHLASVVWSRDSESVVNKYDMTTNLGTGYPSMGLHQRDVLYFGDKLYLISADNDIYWGENPYTEPASTYAGSFLTLANYGDKTFMGKLDGTIYRLAASDAAWTTFYTPFQYLQALALYPFHDFLCIIARHTTGAIGLYRLPDTNALTSHQIGMIHGSTARYTAASTEHFSGCPFAQLADDLYLLTGYLNPIESNTMHLYKFDGTHLRYTAELTGLPDVDACGSLGLLPWRGRLVAYALEDSATTHLLKLLVGDRFVDFAPVTSKTLASYSAMYQAGGDLILIAEDGAGNEGFFYTQGLSDGYVTTTYLDMMQPGRKKQLHSITAHLSRSITDFFVKLYYKIDDAQSWTQAGTSQEETIRPTAEDLDQEFYLLQVKVEIDDDTGDNEDIAIEKISASYSADLG